MGMAPFGSPRYVDKVWKLIRVQPDGSFELDMDYFAFHHSTHQTFSRKFTTAGSYGYHSTTEPSYYTDQFSRVVTVFAFTGTILVQ